VTHLGQNNEVEMLSDVMHCTSKADDDINYEYGKDKVVPVLK
jgi:hypothetical protein